MSCFLGIRVSHTWLLISNLVHEGQCLLLGEKSRCRFLRSHDNCETLEESVFHAILEESDLCPASVLGVVGSAQHGE